MSVRFKIDFKKSKKSQGSDDPLAGGISLPGTNGICVILVHGFTGAPHEMSFVAKFLNKKGFSVFCPRLANHGEPLEVLRDTTWQECYQSIRRMFIHLKKNNPGEAIFVAGLSISALLALLLADEFGSEVSGVVCLSPILFYDGWNSPWCRHFLPITYCLGLKNFFYFKEEPPFGIKNEMLQRRVHDHYKRASLENMKDVSRYGYPYYPVALLYQHRLLVRHLITRLPFVRVPVQLVQARHDDISSARNSQCIYDRIDSKVKDILWLDNSYHVVTVDQEWEKVAQGLHDFFFKVMSLAPKEGHELKVA
ncbi:MAG: alpha/beta fold hydrolase [Candidatus Omnitrophica bacterium]|nr:alpha/beta fold hydrolase [Candidatus Omnitrophota bacterium]